MTALDEVRTGMERDLFSILLYVRIQWRLRFPVEVYGSLNLKLNQDSEQSERYRVFLHARNYV